MYGYVAVISPEAVRFLGREPDFDTFMGLLTGDDGLELGQMWDAVDQVVGTLLEGRAWIASGTPVTDDLGCGPAMFLSVDEVRSMAASLSGVSDDRLAAAFTSAAPRADYPDVWDRPEELAMLESCTLTATRGTIALLERAAVQQLGMIFVVV